MHRVQKNNSDMIICVRSERKILCDESERRVLNQPDAEGGTLFKSL